jgi:citrate lyase subunit beta/citryl-CoA lyase
MALPRLERSVYVLPATDWPLLQAAAGCRADLVLMDLDDLVAPEDKVPARANVIRSLKEINWGSRALGFRMNALTTPWAYRDLVEVVEAAGEAVHVVVVPKVDRPEDVYFVDVLLAQLEAYVGLQRPISVEVQIETARGMLNIGAIAAASPRIEALVFGPGDYYASIHLPLEDGAHDPAASPDTPFGWQFAMHQIVVAARACGVRAVDGPFADVHSLDDFARSCQTAYRFGCDGKWCIHPSQVEIANRAFVPDRDQIRHARAVISAFGHGRPGRDGLSLLDGKMVDAAVVKNAEVTLERARRAGLLDELD